MAENREADISAAKKALARYAYLDSKYPADGIPFLKIWADRWGTYREYKDIPKGDLTKDECAKLDGLNKRHYQNQAEGVCDMQAGMAKSDYTIYISGPYQNPFHGFTDESDYYEIPVEKYKFCGTLEQARKKAKKLVAEYKKYDSRALDGTISIQYWIRDENGKAFE